MQMTISSGVTTDRITKIGKEDEKRKDKEKGKEEEYSEAMEEKEELFEAVKHIMDKSEMTEFIEEKKKFENDSYAYSLCDDYKSRKTEKVVSYLIYKKNINILYYTDDYKYIMFINFLRWCQLCNFPVKKFHDLFLKWDIVSYPEYEKCCQFFLKPALDNDRLLWDVDRDFFEEGNIGNDAKKKRKNETVKEREESIYEEQDLKDDISSDMSQDFDVSSEEHSIDYESESESESKSDEKMDPKSESTPKSEMKPEVEFERDFKFRSNCPVSKTDTRETWGQGKASNKSKIDKRIMENWNNLHLNNLVDAIMMKKNINEESEKKENEKKSIETEEKTTEALIKKFVSASDNEREEITNLQIKVSSMETIIKYLIAEILKRDMVQNLPVGETNLTNCTMNKEEKTTTNVNRTIDNESTTQRYRKEGERELSEMDDNTKEKKQKTDSSYFGSYNFLEIHRTMILDKVRTSSYYEFIIKNKDLFKGKRVLDVGCGSGIISLFCSDFCKTVVGIDNAEKILSVAEKIIERNKATNIFLFKGKLEEHTIYIDEKEKIYYLPNNINIEDFEKKEKVKLQLLQFDIIISEWMGYFLFYECMIDTIIHARNVYLKKGGYMFPNKVNLYVSGYDDTNQWKEDIQVWENKLYNKYFIELKPDQKNYVQNGKIIKANKKNVVTDIIHYYTIDLYTYKKQDAYIYTSFRIPVKKSKIISSLCFHFDCIFDSTSSTENDDVKNGNEKKWK